MNESNNTIQINTHRDKQWKNKIKTHGSAYRKKIRINEEAIKDAYKKTKSLELGLYRHNANYINYDYLVNKALTKWKPRDERLALEIIHSIHNKSNSLILKCLLEADREVRPLRND